MNQFFQSWLDSWTGNNPEKLLSFYADNAFYCDPHFKEGLEGRDAIRHYFQKLLAKNPEWTWSLIEYHGHEDQYYVKWKCEIPVNGEVFKTTGLDIVWIKNKLITRNEVYFDTHELKMMFVKN